ncbi:hypothetical protein [Streptomyces sp. NRRL B-24484]|uniref:hypothetical protein n=1 Tax=Streptomyces sp. NRRL B-24484 TaxID=1463833 RepID=UPI0006948FC7|nr:hypothetical protein [Streptomyces sp. NRRL B-24484]
MRTRSLTVVVAAVAALGLAGCSGSTGSTPKADPAAPASAAAPATPAASGAAASDPAAATPTGAKPAPPSDAGLPAEPDAGTAAKLVAALKALNPDIVSAGPEKTVEAARKECQAVYNYPKDRAKLVEVTGSTFTSATHPQGFGPEVSAKILAAVQASGLCTRP